MEFSAGMIASLIGGTIIGDPEAKVNNFAKIEEGDAGCISFWQTTSMSTISMRQKAVSFLSITILNRNKK